MATSCRSSPSKLLWLAVSYLLQRAAHSYIVGAALLPHGTLILDPRNFNGTSDNATDAATGLHYAAASAAAFVRSLEPEVLLLITPHGLSHPHQFLFYHNSIAAGSVDTDAIASRQSNTGKDSGGRPFVRCAYPPCVYNASAHLDAHLSHHLASALAASGAAVSTLSGFGPPGNGALPLPLAWAEVVPLYFIERAFSELQPGGGQAHLAAAEDTEGRSSSERQRRLQLRRRLAAQPGGLGGGAASGRASAKRVGGDGGAPMPRIMVMSMPTRRYDHSVEMTSECLSLGKSLFAQLDPLDERIAIVVSGDLAHTWEATGPYGFSDHAARFDAAITQWARDLDRNALLKTAAKNVAEAKSCGFPGMVVLQGVVDQVKADNLHSVLLDVGHPSYYGMMCAVWDFQGDA